MRQNPNDETREAILGLLYSIHQRARGIRSTGISISKIKQALKKQGFKAQEVVSNLDYLIQTKWVVREVEEYPLKRSGITITARRVTYKISDIGINHFQGISRFQNAHKFEGIKVMNIHGVTVIGENNVVYNQYSELFRNLDLLDTEIQKSDRFTDEEKLSCHADIDTIKSQLAKSKPTRDVLKAAWEGLKAVATIGSLLSLYQTITTLITPLLA